MSEIDKEKLGKALLELSAVVDITSRIATVALSKVLSVNGINIVFNTLSDTPEFNTEIMQKTINTFRIATLASKIALRKE